MIAVITFVVGLLVGAAVMFIVFGRYVVGYWPWQGEEAQRRAGW